MSDNMNVWPTFRRSMSVSDQPISARYFGVAFKKLYGLDLVKSAKNNINF